MTEKTFHAETDGVIDQVEVTIRTEGDDEHLAELIHQDLVNRAHEINQIVELQKHPTATNPEMVVDWEGWLEGEVKDEE
jgi:hypothetical protein